MAELTPNATPPDCGFGNKAGPTSGKSESADDSADVSPNAHTAATKSSGETATDTLFLTTESKGGSAKNVGADSTTEKTLLRLKKQLKPFELLKRSH